jgi:hypothetical protein
LALPLSSCVTGELPASGLAEEGLAEEAFADALALATTPFPAGAFPAAGRLLGLALADAEAEGDFADFAALAGLADALAPDLAGRDNAFTNSSFFMAFQPLMPRFFAICAKSLAVYDLSVFTVNTGNSFKVKERTLGALAYRSRDRSILAVRDAAHKHRAPADKSDCRCWSIPPGGRIGSSLVGHHHACVMSDDVEANRSKHDPSHALDENDLRGKCVSRRGCPYVPICCSGLLKTRSRSPSHLCPVLWLLRVAIAFPLILTTLVSIRNEPLPCWWAESYFFPA